MSRTNLEQNKTDLAIGEEAAHTSISQLLRPAIVTALGTMERRIQTMIRLATGAWPALVEARTQTDQANHNASAGTSESTPEHKDEHERHARALIERYRQEAKEPEVSALDQAGLLAAAARQYNDVLGESEAAIETILEALRLDTSSENSRQFALQLLFQDRGGDLRRQQLERLAETANNSKEPNALLLDEAIQHEFVRVNFERAKEIYRQILATDPDSIEANEGLLRLLLNDGAWHDLATHCSTMAGQEAENDVRSSLLILSALLADTEPIVTRARWIAQAAAINPASTLALPLAAGLYTSADDNESAIRIHLEQSDVDNPEAGRLRFQASWMFARYTQKMNEAIQAAEEAHALDPENILYLSWLVEIYEEEGRWPELAQALAKKAACPTSEQEIVASLFHLAEIQRTRLLDPGSAITTLEQALQLSPTDIACLQQLGRLYAEAERWKDLVRMHLCEAAATSDPARQANARYRAGRTLVTKIGAPEEAIEHLEQAIEIYPALRPAYCLLEDLYRKTARFQDLVALYRKEITLTQIAAQRVSLFERIASILDFQLNDPDAAISAYEEVLEQDPHNAVALAALARLYEFQENFSALLPILSAQVDRTENEEQQSQILLRMGQIAEEELSDLESALEYFRKALALRSSAIGYEHAGRLLHKLERWHEVLELTQAELNSATECEHRARLFFRIGFVYEQHLNDLQQAASAYQMALSADPGHWPAVRGLARAAHHLPDLRRLCLEGMMLEKLSDPEFRSRAQTRIALSLLPGERSTPKELLRSALTADQDNRLAKAILLQLLVEDGEWDDVLDALGPAEGIPIALGMLFDQSRALNLAWKDAQIRPESLCTARWLEWLQSTTTDSGAIPIALEQRIDKEQCGARIETLRLRLAHWLVTHQPDSLETTKICEKMLTHKPVDPRALNLLETWGRKRGDESTVRNVVSTRAQDATDPAQQALAHCQMAEILRKNGEHAKAAQSWHAALEIDKECRSAYEALKQVYAGDNDHLKLLWVLEQHAESIPGHDSRVGDLLSRSDLYRQNGQEDAALRDLHLILDRCPAQINALNRISAILGDRSAFRELAQILERAVAALPIPEGRAGLAVKLALIYRDHLDEPAAAAKVLADATASDPDAIAALLAAADLRCEMDQPTEAIALLNRAVLRAQEPDELVGAHLALARLYHDIIDDTDRAKRSLEAALEVNPSEPSALLHLADIADTRGDDEQQENYLLQIKEIGSDAPQYADIVCRLTCLSARRLGAADEDVQRLIKEAISVAKHPPAEIIRLAIEGLSARESWDELAALLNDILPHFSGDTRVEFLLAYASILGQELERKEEAQTHLREALHLAPERGDVAERLLHYFGDDALDNESMRDEAIDLHRMILSTNPLVISSIRRLAQLCERANRSDEAYCAESALIVLGEANEEEIYFYKQRRRLLPSGAPGKLHPKALKALVLPLGSHPLQPLLRILGTILCDLIPPDLSIYGFDVLENAHLGKDHPARALIESCRTLLGITKVSICEAMGGTSEGATEPGRPPAVILPREFVRLPLAQQKFHAGRLLGRIASGTESFDAGRGEPFTPRTMEIICAAILRIRDTDFGDTVAPIAMLDDLGKRIADGLSKKHLEKAHRIATHYRNDPAGTMKSFASWLEACDLGACRAGMLCCGGLDNLAFRFENGPHRFAEPLRRGLAAFAVSKHFSDLRRDIGSALGPADGEREHPKPKTKTPQRQTNATLKRSA